MNSNSLLLRTAVAFTFCLAPHYSAVGAQQESTSSAESVVSSEPTPQEQLKALGDELVAFRKTIPMEWMVKFPDPSLVQEGTKETLRDLYRKLQLFYAENLEQTDENESLYGQWAYNFKGVYTHRIMLEWQDFDAAWGEFLDLERKFSKIRTPRNPQAHQRFTASLADTSLRLWTGEHASVPFASG